MDFLEEYEKYKMNALLKLCLGKSAERELNEFSTVCVRISFL